MYFIFSAPCSAEGVFPSFDKEGNTPCPYIVSHRIVFPKSVPVPLQYSRTADAAIDTSPENYLSYRMLLDANAAIDAVYRSEWGRIVAALIRLFGDFDLAEEAAQEAFAAAVGQWQSSGIPENPRAWLIQAARNK